MSKDWLGLLERLVALCATACVIILCTALLVLDEPPQTDCSCAHGHEVTP